MKAIEWVRYLTDQRERYSKTLFTVTELANVADASPAVINVELGRLIKQGVVRRWVPGRYGLPEGVTAEALAAAIDCDAYVTGAYALAYHGYVTQAPREIECFTRRRHNRSRTRPGPLGTLVFVTVSPRVYALPAEGRMAGPEQAFCDLFSISRRRGLDPRTLFTFRKLEKLDFTTDLLDRYPQTVQHAVAGFTQSSRRARIHR
jgi:hypothetical protein